MNNPGLRTSLADINYEWLFIPTRAPWVGAIWERASGILRLGLKKVSGRAIVTAEELYTVLELEAAVNDKPSSSVSSDLDEPTPITPFQLTGGRRVRSFPHHVVTEDLTDPAWLNADNISSRYKYMCKLSADVWKRWLNESLLSQGGPTPTRLHQRTLTATSWGRRSHTRRPSSIVLALGSDHKVIPWIRR